MTTPTAPALLPLQLYIETRDGRALVDDFLPEQRAIAVAKARALAAELRLRHRSLTVELIDARDDRAIYQHCGIGGAR